MNGLILGSGMTGLAAGIKTGLPIYEKGEKPGGLCRSYQTQGFRFDHGGGHWIFNCDKVREFVASRSALSDYSRIASVYINRYIPYPIQREFSHADRCAPGSLKHWMRKKFGNDLGKLFFYPFNDKYTQGLYRHVIQDDAFKSPGPSCKGYNDRFSYPNKGHSDFADKLALDNNIHYYKEAVRIDTSSGVVHFSDGDTARFDKLISTLPLKETMRLCGQKCKDLEYTSVQVLNIGATPGPLMPKDHWIYIPDQQYRFFRVQFYSNVDPMFAPEGSVSLCVERAFLPGSKPEPDYHDHVIRTLKQWGWIQDVVVVDPNWIEFAYTWMSHKYGRPEYLKWLEDKSIISIGRYGKWKFQGIADSIMDGLSV